MKKCGYCGFDNDDAARYCGDCACSLDVTGVTGHDQGEHSQPELTMVTIKRYMDLGQAERDKSLLGAASIPSFLAGENSASIGYGSILGELRLQVQEANADRARRVLDEHDGFSPLPDDFVPPADPAQAGARLETMETSTNDAESSTKNVVVSVVITLLVVIVAIVTLNPRKTSSSEAGDRARREYEQRAQRAEALLTAEEQQHQRYVEFLTKAEENQRRYEKILATWEQQQQEYQRYLDGLEKKH